jgi:hypothetical protein
MPNFAFRSCIALALLWLAATVAAVPLSAETPTIAPLSAADRAEAIAIFKQLIEINTTDTPLGNVTDATVAMQKRFLDAGFSPDEVHLLGPTPRKQNLVVRIKGTTSAKSFRRCPKTGIQTRSSSSSRMATTTAAAPRT